jgi:hypothetical protein
MDQQVHTYYNFSPLTACLAVNYLDRFLSLYQLPVREKRWKSICAVSWEVITSIDLTISARQGLDDTAALRGVPVPGRQDGGDLCSSTPPPAGERDSETFSSARPVIVSCAAIHLIRNLVLIAYCRSGRGRAVRVRSQDDSEDGAPRSQHARMEDASGHSFLVHRLLPPPAQRRRCAVQALRRSIC